MVLADRAIVEARRHSMGAAVRRPTAACRECSVRLAAAR